VRCPFCASPKTGVVETRIADPGDAVRRRRSCAECGERFTTYERVEAPPITVVKRDGTKVPFDRQKLLRGLSRAAGGRPVTNEQLEGLADAIAASLRGKGPEVDAGDIGELALRGLAEIDPVSGILFASVYRKFADLAELEEEVRRLKGQDDPVPSDPRSNIGLSPSRGQGERTDQRSKHVRQP
jgi:transcriptional repressor NrdR